MAPPGSTYAVDEFGLSGIYAVLTGEKLAMRWERAPGRLPRQVDRLVVWQPGTIRQEDWSDLLRWVGDGHTLIIASNDQRLPGSLDSMAPAASGSAAAHPVTLALKQVDTGYGVFGSVEGTPLVHLTRQDGTPVLVSWTHGQGRIYWSADAEWLSNARIDRADNLDLALQLLAPARGRKTAFDEFHHGFRAPDRWWQMLRGSLQAFVAQFALALVLFYWAFGARFGNPTPLPAMVPRASVEYVFSMSQLYRRSGARPVAAEALHRSLTRELSRFLGGTGGLDHAEVARRTAQRTGMAPHRIEHALERTAPGATPPPSDSELILLSREVEAIQRSVQHAGFRDQRNPGTGSN